VVFENRMLVSRRWFGVVVGGAGGCKGRRWEEEEVELGVGGKETSLWDGERP
jgi:hypothetical protein